MTLATFPSIIEKEGYVTASPVEQYAGIEEAEAAKRLRSLSKKHKWNSEQDPRKPDVIKYLPPHASESAVKRSRQKTVSPSESQSALA